MKKRMPKGIIYTILICVTVLSFVCYQNYIGNKPTTEKLENEEEKRVVVPELNVDYCDTYCYLQEHIETIEFLAKTVGINTNEVVDNLVLINSNSKVKEDNIGRLTDNKGNLLNYGSLEKGLIEYLFDYADKHPSSVDNTRVPYNGSAKYVEDLIKYFTQIYDNVDYLTAVSIGAAESGYYQVKYMLNCNNVYGGMSSSGLIVHKTIEYGVLSYVRMLSRNYYAKGLTTKESIGYVYCPVTNEYGQKTASPHWLNLVSTAMAHYRNTEETVSVSKLMS